MATNLLIDDELLVSAQKIGGFKTKRETVNQALLDFIQRKKRIGIITMFGKVEYDDSYDYKEERNKNCESDC